MTKRRILNILVRNAAGLLTLFAVHYVADYSNLVERSGVDKFSPYLFLLMMYGWIVFHNRILFERLYMRNRKAAYFVWTLLAMAVSSFNMHYILTEGFQISYTLPHIVSFWVYTVTGLGVYVIWKHLKKAPNEENKAKLDALAATEFACTVDGIKQGIPYSSILYLESLENYIRIITDRKSLIVRQPLKEAEERLPKPLFIRISRSHIVNSQHINSVSGNSVIVRNKELKVGKVFKKYVEEQLK